jgi:outer membrane protein TolC
MGSAGRRFRRVLGSLGLLLAAPAFAVSDGTGLQSAEALFPELETILHSALKQSPRMIAENLDLMEAEHLKRVSSSGLYPDVGGFVNFFAQNESRLQQDGSTENVDLTRVYYAISANQTLYHWGAVRAAAEVGKIRAEIEKNNVLEAYRKLALEIRREYLDLIIEKASLQRAELGLAAIRRDLATKEVAVELGAISRGLVSGARTALARAELARDRSARDFEDSIFVFSRLTGVEGFSAVDIPEEIPKVTLASAASAQSWYDNYVEQNLFEDDPRFVANRLQVESEKLNESIIKTNLRPKLNLLVGATQDERSDTVNVGDRYQYTAVYAGVGVNWRIFDGYESRGRRLVAGTRIQRLEMNMEKTAEDLVRDVDRAVSDLGFAQRSLELAEKHLGGVTLSVKRTREDVELGRGSADSIAAAELAELSARIEAFAQRAGYLRAASQLLSSVGADPVVEAAIPGILKR